MGKTESGWIRDGLDAYVSRLARYVPFSLIELPDLKKAASWSKARIQDKEAGLLLSRIGPADEVILLDERGTERRSADFAALLQTRLSRSGRDLVFVIGGAYGFSQQVYDRADDRLSLSRLTFPHQLVRVIFAEQLYRAFTILKGEPYHHE